MKKWISMIVVLVMVFSLAACASQKAPEESAAPAEKTDAAEPAAPEGGEEDGQNPIMNFVGVYACDRASMTVEAADAKDGAKVTVTWSSSAAEHSEWAMTGTFDADKLTITYDDCVRTDVVFNEDGSVKSENVVYENGKGTITFSDGEKLSLTWDDAEENMADGMVFEYAV
jgi:predicted small lipoprotein YifL